MMRAVPPIHASFHPAFPQHSSFQDANGKKQTVSGFSLSRKEFAMHVCLLCLTLALIFYFSGCLLSKKASSTDISQVSHLLLIL